MALVDDVDPPTDLGRRRLSQNPFYVLGVAPQAPPATLEAEANALLQILARDPASHVYPTPVGPRRRDACLVRKALASVSSPNARVLHEVWAVLPPTWSERDDAPAAAYPGAMEIFGWRSRPTRPEENDP